MIVVNGGPGYDSQSTFRGLKVLASTSLRVVAYDQRGVGRTTAPAGPKGLPEYTLMALVSDLEALRVRLGAKRIDLLGHSFGALVAAAYTAIHPARVRSLTLAAGLPMSLAAQHEGDARFDRRVASLQRRGLLPKVIPEGCAASSQVLLPAYLGNLARAPTVAAALGVSRCNDLVATLENNSIETDPLRHKLQSRLANYRGPALVVIGARDPFGSAWATDDAAPLRNARLTKRVLANAGHFVWLESPAFIPLVRSFIAAN